jgi:HSP20 family protein
MYVTKCNPDRGLVTLNNDLQGFFKGFGLDSEALDTVWYPSVDVAETEQVYELKAEIPGLKKEDVKLTLEDNVLTLQGERKEEAENRKKNIQISERVYGRFQRSFRLPREVKAENIKAAYKDGVLTVEIPKAEQSKPKEIAVA